VLTRCRFERGSAIVPGTTVETGGWKVGRTLEGSRGDPKQKMAEKTVGASGNGRVSGVQRGRGAKSTGREGHALLGFPRIQEGE